MSELYVPIIALAFAVLNFFFIGRLVRQRVVNEFAIHNLSDRKDCIDIAEKVSQSLATALTFLAFMLGLFVPAPPLIQGLGAWGYGLMSFYVIVCFYYSCLLLLTSSYDLHERSRTLRFGNQKPNRWSSEQEIAVVMIVLLTGQIVAIVLTG